MKRLPRSFYGRPARLVAKDLLGKRLVSMVDGRRVGGDIVETEAYCDTEERDLACHGDRANEGRPTLRTAVMFGPPGFSYVYFTYGMHWMFNIVTGDPGYANAVLIRALEPMEGLETMRAFRARPDLELTNGPAKLAQALTIDQAHNGLDLCEPESSIWIEDGLVIEEDKIRTGPRIGLGKTPEPWLSIPWRYWIDGNPYVSR
ncbi:MAG: DNA-3-methyladenine glycosylase [Candidatus Promineifilaceae bacterium]|jgi:DNA-3-methyladenine glycosylase